ncbi:right-handed parallel beta-helix repeat-containing protein [Tessaracoccus flavus]|uniref:Right handed beta helix domain-containing protein n=1 Tax=Tessaracoccus flavus TaxID=1610493 RepID=A0A1Q2CBU9_9ACTN|nr:right-handed parallel beta-helix repeat-containing protein [Tessaracoccus flavus]AQP43586.1 hypothetical protein RPIT_01085 [Tessaracoccus flavus]SDY87946.1 Right handed beta helix region [Tessaracoccus flavus]
MRAGSVAAALMCAVLAACSTPTEAPSTPAPATTETTAAGPTPWATDRCRELADGVGAALQAVVDSYEQPAPSPAPGSDGDDLEGSLATVQEAVEEGHCAPQTMQGWVEASVDAVKAEGTIAEAVRARLVAGLDGRIPTELVHVPVAPGEDLATAVSEAPSGATLQLAAGTFDLAEPLVLLGGITIAGAGQDETVLRSSAEDTAVLIATSETVSLEGLTIERDDTVTGSGIVAGGAASLVLEAVTVSGAVAGDTGGGAAVMLMGTQEGAERKTTAEITDSTLSGNDWAGLAVSGTHRVSVKSSTFADNGECGVCFLGESDGSVADSWMDANPVGVAMAEQSTPTLIGNAITGGEVGLQVQDDAAPIAEKNIITNPERAAVIVSGKAAGAFAENVCADVEFGIVVTDTAAPTLTHNECALARGQTESASPSPSP